MAEYLKKIRAARPLIHSITNYVTANDCANLLLACGASPIMADDPEEAAEITSLCDGLCINLGTLDNRRISSMLLSGKAAENAQIPILLDPVGAGASKFRTNAARLLLNELDISVIRGNISEIKAIFLGSDSHSGVDADICDRVTEDTLYKAAAFAKQCAIKSGAVIMLSGEIDIIADSIRACIISGGHWMMSRVTGTGCQLSALITAYAAVSRTDIFGAVCAAAADMKFCGEAAFSRMMPQDGNASYRNYLIDAVFNLTDNETERNTRSELR